MRFSITIRKIQWVVILFGSMGFWLFSSADAINAKLPAKTPYTVCFSPNGHCERQIISLINKTKKNLYIQSYSFTSWGVLKALLHAKNRGVLIRVIADRSLFDPRNTHTRIAPLILAGIPVWVDHLVSIQHNKVMISDESTVETGSYNFTVSANRYNAENVLIIKDKTLALTYLKNWRSRQSVSTPSAHYHYQKKSRHSRRSRKKR